MRRRHGCRAATPGPEARFARTAAAPWCSIRMQVLICDDDATVRLIAKRVLQENLGCLVRECKDGVEALAALGSERYSFVLLDVEMPTLNGVDTLEEIRASATTKDLPVIMMTSERGEQVVSRLLQLGISDYLVKPVRPTTLISKVEALLKTLPPEQVFATDVSKLRVARDRPAMLVDGNLDYRFFFATEVERYGPVIQADTGAAALAMFRRSPADVVFVGSNLGVVSPERLVQRLRELRPSGVRLIRIGDGDAPDDPAPFDAVIRRSYVPDTFRAGIRPYVMVAGPMGAVSEILSDLRELIASAVRQVFGMMFQAEIADGDPRATVDTQFSATVEMRIADRFVPYVGIHLPEDMGRATAERMLGMERDEVGEEELQSIAGELSNLVTGRLHAQFRERELSSVTGLPKLHTGPGVPAPDEGEGVLQSYVVSGAGPLLVSLVTRDLLRDLLSEPAAADGRQPVFVASGS